jgi:hypothetical protein
LPEVAGLPGLGGVGKPLGQSSPFADSQALTTALAVIVEEFDKVAAYPIQRESA